MSVTMSLNQKAPATSMTAIPLLKFTNSQVPDSKPRKQLIKRPKSEMPRFKTSRRFANSSAHPLAKKQFNLQASNKTQMIPFSKCQSKAPTVKIGTRLRNRHRLQRRARREAQVKRP